jgi:2-methylisocitrate lyase-like PEP mutase family enzyme
MSSSLREKATLLRDLHYRDSPLVFVNAWDAVSARIAESLGFPAIATTSSGIANAEGYPDGQRISRSAMLSRVQVIARAVDIPVTADLEGGYGSTVDDAVATARGAIESGAVGLNLEDSSGDATAPLLDPLLQAQRIRAMRIVGDDMGVPLVVNARVDSFHFGTDNEARLRDAGQRAAEYIRAGADCIFVPFVRDKEMIARLVAAIPAPLNVLAGLETPDIATLAQIGVRRVSVGGGPAGHAMAAFRDAALEVRDRGTFAFAGQRLSHAELNNLFAPTS